MTRKPRPRRASAPCLGDLLTAYGRSAVASAMAVVLTRAGRTDEAQALARTIEKEAAR